MSTGNAGLIDPGMVDCFEAWADKATTLDQWYVMACSAILSRGPTRRDVERWANPHQALVDMIGQRNPRYDPFGPFMLDMNPIAVSMEQWFRLARQMHASGHIVPPIPAGTSYEFYISGNDIVATGDASVPRELLEFLSREINICHRQVLRNAPDNVRRASTLPGRYHQSMQSAIDEYRNAAIELLESRIQPVVYNRQRMLELSNNPPRGPQDWPHGNGPREYDAFTPLWRAQRAVTNQQEVEREFGLVKPKHRQELPEDGLNRAFELDD